MTQGLPVKGYKPTQSPEAIEAVNAVKVAEERFLREVDALSQWLDPGEPQRCLALARSHIQTGTMWAARAVFQPQRLGDEDLG